MLSNGLASPFRHAMAVDASTARLCLNQTAYALHELAPGRRAAEDDLVLRFLRTPGDLDSVRSLRSHIDLTHSAGDPLFETHEKKETK
jgi:hypothetical protein